MTYQLWIDNDVAHTFTTLADVLHHLNDRPDALRHPYKGKADDLAVWRDGALLPLRVRHLYNYQHLGLDLSEGSNAAEWLTLMLDEVMPYACRPDGTIRPPHEMTAAQWGAITVIGDAAFGVLPCFSQEQHRAPVAGADGRTQSLIEFFCAEFQRRFGYGHNGPTYGNGADINKRHELHVKYALIRGDHVPQAVIDDYLARPDIDTWRSMPSFVDLLRMPFLRGRFRSAEHYQMAHALLIHQGFRFTQPIAEGVADLLNGLPATADRDAIDDLLYAHGLLRVRPQPAPPDAATLGTPVNAFAARHRDAIVALRQKIQRKDLESHARTKRERDYRLAGIEAMALYTDYSASNRLATALLDKNIGYLLEVLDRPDNEVSKRAVEEACGVKLRNVSAAQRRRAVFTAAGCDTEEAYQAALARLAEQERAHKAAAEHKEALERQASVRESAERTKVTYRGQTCSMAELIDRLYAEGYTRVVADTRSAVKKYMLVNPTTDYFIKLSRKDHSLDYARLVIAQAEAQQIVEPEATAA